MVVDIFWLVVVGDGGYILASDGWLWVVVDIFWLVVDIYWLVAVGGGSWWLVA